MTGPAILIDDISTVVVEPRCVAHVTAGRDLRIELRADAGASAQAQTECDPIQLAVFSHRCLPLPRGTSCSECTSLSNKFPMLVLLPMHLGIGRLHQGALC